MKITFIMPSIGKKPGDLSYVKTWQMEPLQIAILSALTPSDINREFYDDRLENINYETQTDLVAITVETYTARRSYEIAYQFRKKNVKVVMGGFHATLVPEEVRQYCDILFVGEAEGLWEKLIIDLKNNELKSEYINHSPLSLANIFPDRTIFSGKRYQKLGLIETGRGCTFNCDFCSIQKFYKRTYRYRPLEDVVTELKSLPYKYYFFVDDNIVANIVHAKKLFTALIPLKIKWFTQGSINMADDPELLDLMKRSGCLGVLIGFESLNDKTLSSMNKGINLKHDREKSILKIQAAGIKIYGSFVFGHENDQEKDFDKTFRFVLKHKFFIAAFNHLVPFPGTEMYERFKRNGSLINEKYWLDHNYCFGDVSYRPQNFSAETLSRLCFLYRKKFYSTASIFTRFFNRTNFQHFSHPFFYLLISILSRRDAKKRQGLPMGTGQAYE